MMAEKRPESVLVLVCAGYRVLLMERRSPRGFWQSVTGSLHWGESPMQAARRELREETGIEAGIALMDLQHTERFPIVHPWKERYPPHARYNLEHWFVLLLPSQRLVRLNPAEHVGYRWLDAHRAAREAASWTNAAAIRAQFASVPR